MSILNLNFSRITLNTGRVADIDKALKAQSAKLTPLRYDGPTWVRGRWKVEPFTVPEHSTGMLRLVRDGGRGSGPGKYHRLVRDKHTVVMSDTDAELIDFLPMVQDVEGRILIGGLGMGLVVKALCLTGKTSAITVIEQEKVIIDNIGPWVTALGKRNGVRVSVIAGSIFDYKPDRSYDWMWFDIWDDISDENLPEFTKLRLHYRRYITHSGRMRFWAENECRKMKRGLSPAMW